MPNQAKASSPADSNDHERAALDEVFSLVYEELRRLASFVRKNEASATINSTALVHEAWLKLKDSPQLAATSVPHFKAIAAKAMRQVLVDEARRRTAQKRRGFREAIFVTTSDSMKQIASCDADLLALNAALEELAQLNPRQAQMVESRFFGGLRVFPNGPSCLRLTRALAVEMHEGWIEANEVPEYGSVKGAAQGAAPRAA